MQRIGTIPERQAAEAARRSAAVADLLPELARYARTHGGRFLLFGSAAREQMKWHSDVDLLVDFPDAQLSDALAVRGEGMLEPQPGAGYPAIFGM